MKKNLLVNKGKYDNNHKSVKLTPKDNGIFVFHNYHKINTLHLPFLYYNGINYKCRLDNNIIPLHSDSCSLATINSIKRGKHITYIKAQNNKIIIYSRIFTLIGDFIYLYILFKLFRKEHNLRVRNI